MDAVEFCLFFYTTRKCISSHIKKPRGRKECTLGLWFHISGILSLSVSFFLFLMCWLHPWVCSMMVQGIMSRHDSTEEERWPCSCDSSSEGRKPSSKVLRQHYPPVPWLYLGHMTLPKPTMAEGIGITDTWLRTIVIPVGARVQFPQNMRSGGYRTRTEILLGRKKGRKCTPGRPPATSRQTSKVVSSGLERLSSFCAPTARAT